MKYFWEKKKFFLLFIFLCLVYIFSLFSGPVVSDDKQIEYNTRNIHLPYGLGFSVGSDAGNYMRLANNPQLLFEKKRVVKERELVSGNVGLSRPAMFFVIFIISKPIDFLVNKFDFVIEKLHSDVKTSLDYGYKISGVEQEIEDSVPMIRDFYSTYISFFLFNTVLIFFSFSLYCKSIGLSTLSISSYSSFGLWIGLFLIINDITKKYLISPSPSIFNLVAICLTLYACSELKKDSTNKLKLLAFSLIFGLGNLFYEVFLIPLGTLYIIYLKIEILDNKQKIFEVIVSSIKYFLISIVFFITPYLVWILIAEKFYGGFFHFGLDEFPGFSILNNDVLTLIKIVTIKSLNSLWIAFLSLIPLSTLIILFSIIVIRSKGLGIFKSELFLIPIIYSLMTLLFFSAYGEIKSKHTLCIILGFLPFLNHILTMSSYRKSKFLLFSMIVFFFSYSIFVARKTFPYGEGIIVNPLL